MSVPQIIMAIWIAINIVIGVRDFAKNREHTSGWAAVGIFITLGLQLGVAAVLHAGGFW